jgi:hypothetical protein
MRTVKPEYWHDQEITRVSRDARLLYVALWNFSDEHSRMQGDPRYVKGQTFPYDDDLTPEVIDGLLDELVELGSVVRYQVRGAVYLYLPKLGKHQRLDAEKVLSRLPAPEESDESETFPHESGKNPDESAKDPDAIMPDPSTPANTGDPAESGFFPDESGFRANKSALSMLHVAGSKLHGEKSAPGADEKKPGRGTRISPDWKPDPSMLAWQRDNGITDALARRELPKFIDYWAGKSGVGATKVDWSATWRNWLRNTIERSPAKPTRPPGWEFGQ